MVNLKESLLIEQLSKKLLEFCDSALFDTIYKYGSSYPIEFDNYIYEGLIRSYGHNMLIKQLIKVFCSDDEEFNYLTDIEIIDSKSSSNSLKLTFKPSFFSGKITDFESPYFVGPLNNILNLYGYYVSKKDNTTLYVEPRYSEEITNDIYKYDYIYHVTDQKYLDKILKNGLNPKNNKKGSRNYSKRIYFGYGSFEDVIKTSKQIAYDRKLVRPVLLKIKLDKSNKKSFYIDPNIGKDAIYTYDCIKPVDIEVITDVVF